MKRKLFNIASIIRLVFYLFLFLVFIIIPTSYFINNNIYGFDKIFSPTEGVTRAFSALMHGRLIDAFNFNPIFTCAIGPICIIIFFQDIYIIVLRWFRKDKRYSIIESVLLGKLK